MNFGGDAADQIVRYSMEGMDYSLRLSGTLAKNLAVFFAAVLKDQKKSYGKTRMVRMLKENRPLKFFTVPKDRLKEFAREGKKRGLLYVVIRDRQNPAQCEIMVFADDAAKVNRVMDKMNLDFLQSESGEAVQEVAREAEQSEQTVETATETVEMSEGEIQFELGDLEEDFGFEDSTAEPENFTQAQEERNPSEPSLRNSDIFIEPESFDEPEMDMGTEVDGRAEKDGGLELKNGQEKPSVWAELAKIKQEKQEASKQKAPSRNRSKNRSTDRKKKKQKQK